MHILLLCQNNGASRITIDKGVLLRLT